MYPSASEFSAVDTRRLADRVRESILTYIRTRGLEPGARLPTERELIRSFGVSRSTIREALVSLSGQGVIEARPGRGFFVLRPSIDPTESLVSGAVNYSTQVPWRVVEARSVIEAGAIRLAAKRHTAEDIERLETAVENIRQAFAASDLDALAASDSAFHLAVAQASHNDVLAEMLLSLQPSLVQSLRDMYEEHIGAGRHNYTTAVGTHEALLQVILAGDPNAAEEGLIEHLQSNWQQVELWPLDA